MSKQPKAKVEPGETFPDETAIYQIQLKGHLGQQWTGWFDGLTITLAENGTTLLTGPVVDQAALYGLLRKARDLGLPLLAVNRVQAKPTNAAETMERANCKRNCVT